MFSTKLSTVRQTCNIAKKTLDFEHIFRMRQACINSSVIYRRKDKTVNYAAILTMLIDTGSTASYDESKFYSNLILVKVLEYCHDQKSQSVKSLAPTVNRPSGVARAPPEAARRHRAMAWSHPAVPQL